MRDVTLCLLLNETELVLGMKKEGFGAGNYNGFGGKPKNHDKSIIHTAIRELKEESEVKTSEQYMTKVGEITFIFPHNSAWDQVMHVYEVARWEGIPKETKEMKPEVFPLTNVPYDKMWEADQHWMPHVIEGKYVKAKFIYAEDKTLLDHSLKVSER